MTKSRPEGRSPTAEKVEPETEAWVVQAKAKATVKEDVRHRTLEKEGSYRSYAK